MADMLTLPAVEVEAKAPTHAAEANGPPVPPGIKTTPKRPSDELTLEIHGERFTGWEEVRLTRGIEVMPSHFALKVNERLPEHDKLFPIAAGECCRILMGDDVVLTGYVDTYESGIRAGSHYVIVSGRSCTQDLLDCQAGLIAGNETASVLSISASSVFALASDLCSPFGISVSAPHGEGEPLVSLGDGVPQFTIAMGQSVFDVLEPIVRWRRLLMLDATDGNLILDKVGTVKTASGFSVPGSVISAAVGFSKQSRHSLYLPVQYQFDSAFDVSTAMHLGSANFFKPVPDEGAFRGQLRHDGKPRYRPKAVVSEQFLDGIALAQARAEWQKGRDYGRSQPVTVEVPTWRDSAGALWTPNTLADVDIPVLKLAKLTWLITEVTYSRGKRGTIAVVTLMPPEAFAPEPSFYSAFDPQIVQALQQDFLRKSRLPGGVNFNPRTNEQQGGQ